MRCTGHCCKRFPLPKSLDDIRERAKPDFQPTDDRKRLEDGEVIAEMLIFLEEGTYSSGERCFFYTCKYLDPTSGDCLAYDTRPAMCRDYPYGQPCQIKECTAENRGVGTEDQVVVLRRKYEGLKPDNGVGA